MPPVEPRPDVADADGGWTARYAGSPLTINNIVHKIVDNLL
jgi:hypothetical protein